MPVDDRLDRAALVWYDDTTPRRPQRSVTTTTNEGTDIDDEEEENGGCGSYWTGWADFAAIDNSTNHCRNGTRCSVSYRTMLSLVAHLVVRLQQQRITTQLLLEEPEPERGAVSDLLPPPRIIVAVAIPEGPYQCVAVTAVHCWQNAVLLPMDPHVEGRERLRHMMAIADVILVASDRDREMLQKLLDTTTTTTKSIRPEKEQRRPPPPRIWNVKDLLWLSAPMMMTTTTTTMTDQPPLWEQPTASDDGQEQVHPPPRPRPLSERVARSVPQDQRKHFAKGDDPDDNDATTTTTISHMVFTSGTSGGIPKACLSSRRALAHYIRDKNRAHSITTASTVLLASNLSFDPCFSDILATWSIGATLQIAPQRPNLFDHLDDVTHILTTSSLWGTVGNIVPDDDDAVTATACRALAPRLQILALGGEPIPPRLRNVWSNVPGLSLCATFGVTEACVYQTLGQMTVDNTPRTCVGKMFGHMKVRICDEHRPDDLIDIVSSRQYPGEIVLYGDQLDACSGYFQLPEMSAAKFVTDERGIVYYRTGDRGFFDTNNEELHVLGRITGQDDTVKFRGVRVDLTDMEHALLDNLTGVVADAVVVAMKDDDDNNDTTSVQNICAYIVLHERCKTELGLLDSDDAWSDDDTGFLCNEPSLAYLLRATCINSTARASPNKFILLPKLPLTATGKRDRRALPAMMHQATPMPCVATSPPLVTYGRCGRFVAMEIATCLNLTSQQSTSLLTVASTFTMLGGDSLTATRIVRALYARHKHIRDTRHLGGPTGVLDGPLAVIHFLRADTLGAYVDWLDRNGVCADHGTTADMDPAVASHTETGPGRDDNHETVKVQSQGPVLAPGNDDDHVDNDNTNPGYNALLHATAAGFASIAMALLRHCQVDPNHARNDGQRLGKTNRLERKRNFSSTPLHLACRHGLDELVAALLEHHANPKCPNASGMFPIHLAASASGNQGNGSPSGGGIGDNDDGDVVSLSLDEQRRRLSCWEQLIAHGAPLVMADGSGQTVLHAAARSGNVLLLTRALAIWPMPLINLRDQWSRTAVHWAVLNGHDDCVRALLATPGCDPSPRVLGSKHVKSSVILETPLQMCRRVHGGTGDDGADGAVTALTARGRAIEAELLMAIQRQQQQQQQQQQCSSNNYRGDDKGDNKSDQQSDNKIYDD